MSEQLAQKDSAHLRIMFESNADMSAGLKWLDLDEAMIGYLAGAKDKQNK